MHRVVPHPRARTAPQRAMRAGPTFLYAVLRAANASTLPVAGARKPVVVKCRGLRAGRGGGIWVFRVHFRVLLGDVALPDTRRKVQKKLLRQIASQFGYYVVQRVFRVLAVRCCAHSLHRPFFFSLFSVLFLFAEALLCGYTGNQLLVFFLPTPSPTALPNIVGARVLVVSLRRHNKTFITVLYWVVGDRSAGFHE